MKAAVFHKLKDIRVRVFTVGIVPVLTKETAAAGDRKRHYHAVTLFYILHLCPGFLNNSHKFMPHYHIAQLRNHTVVNMEVRTADSGGGNADDRIARIEDYWVFNIVNPDVFQFVKYCCFHSL